MNGGGTWSPVGDLVRDTLPLTRWAKLAMAVQSAISFVTVALVIARSVNILR